MKKTVSLLLLVLFIVIAVGTVYIIKNIVPVNKIAPKPLLAYTFANLKNTVFPKNPITFGEIVNENSDFISQTFYFSVPKTPKSQEMEKVSGLANIPKKAGNYPVVIMLRGYAPDKTYQPGTGTQSVAAFLAKNGYITLAPDFLGFGQSASPSADAFENRFQSYTTALTLLSSLPTLNNGLKENYSGKITTDSEKIGIWGHSNGGHIALAVLAISGVTYPTVLWNPVSVSFPYSILYYTDESDDRGKALRKALADFEKNYDTDLFSPPNYYGWIKAPLEINQGSSDQEVPYSWSDNLVSTLKKDGVAVDYLTYPGADHNMLPDGWSNAVLNTLDFYNKKLGG